MSQSTNAMNPREFFVFADRCRDSDTPEAASRTAVSRAYYAALHRAQNFSDGQELPEVDKKLPHHKRIIMRFSQAEGAEDVVKRLLELKVLRVRADYYLKDHTIQTERAKAIELARGILDDIDALPIKQRYRRQP